MEAQNSNNRRSRERREQLRKICIHRAVLVSICALFAGGADARAGSDINDYLFVHTTNGLLSRYKVEANGTLTDQGDLALPVRANDTAAFASRGLLYVALGQQGVDPLLQVQVYAVDFATGGLTLLQTLNVTEEPSRIVVTDAGNADVIYMVSENSLRLTAFVLNADGTIGLQIDLPDQARQAFMGAG